jgi:hypothetical protein
VPGSCLALGKQGKHESASAMSPGVVLGLGGVALRLLMFLDLGQQA